jgi:galactokinase
VGTFGGSQDHTAILCGRSGELMQYSFCPVRFERAVPLPAGYGFVVASSGVVAEKTGGAREGYNAASRRAAAVAEAWRSATGRSDATMAAALDSTPGAAERLRALLEGEPELFQRFEQFRVESTEIIPAAADALMRRELARLGELVDRSQAGAEAWLGNQIPETSFLARSARELGAVAASAFGAGFGGSVWALVPDGEAGTFRARWKEAYSRRFPAVCADFLAVRAGPPAVALAPTIRGAASPGWKQ